MSVAIGTLDSMTIQSLAHQEYVTLVTSVPGQDTPPQNGPQLSGPRTLLRFVKTFFPSCDVPSLALEIATTDLDPKMLIITTSPAGLFTCALSGSGVKALLNLAWGDDQDTDGAETEYKIWEPKVWNLNALGVDKRAYQSSLRVPSWYYRVMPSHHPTLSLPSSTRSTSRLTGIFVTSVRIREPSQPMAS